MMLLSPIQLLGYVLAGLAGHYDLAGDLNRDGMITVMDLLACLALF